MLLSKSNFMNFLDCPCHLWLEKMHKELVPPTDAATQRLFDQGNLVDEKARELFPNGVTVQGFNFDGWKNTQRALATNATVLYQPTIVVDDFSCRADVLVRSGDGWDLHEVKMSTGISDGHYNDASFQKMCFDKAGVTINKVFLTYINREYVRHGAIDAKQLFIDEDISKQVQKRQASVAELALQAKQVFGWGSVLRPEHVSTCKDPYMCEWIKAWTDTLPEDERAALFAGVSLPPDKEVAPLHIDKPAIKEELERFEYPLYFFDYETHASALPSFDGYRPYQQIPFQFSVYVIEYPGATPVTHDFLAKNFVDPVPELLEAFKEVMGSSGTVISWYAPFEKARNEEMALAHPEYAELLQSVNERTYDLMMIFKLGLYVDPRFGGSNSLKKVMPVLVPDLSYDNLAIHEGGTASASWAIVTDPTMSQEQRDQLYTDMIEYCRLDVYGMVKIVDVLKDL